MAQYSVVSGIPQGLPDAFDELVIDSTTTCRVLEPSEYYDVTPLSWPKSSITKVMVSPRTLTTTFFGMHANSATADFTVNHGTVRSHDSQFGGQSLRWNSIEPSDGAFNWASMDAWVAAHAGKDLIYVAGFCPAWATATTAVAGPYGTGTAQFPNLTHWADFLTQVATRYSSSIKYWEICNEVNVAEFWVGTHTQLAQMMRVASQTIKAIDPTAKIISPSIVGIEAASARTYLANILDASDGAASNGAAWMDLCGVHTYCNADIVKSTAAMYTDVRTVLSTRGHSSTPIWSTEVGMNNPKWANLPLDHRKTLLKRTLAMHAACGFDRCCWYGWDYTNGYALNDNQEGPQVWDEVVSILLSGEITAANMLYDGRVALKINNNNYLF